jgi:hypothetical protein
MRVPIQIVALHLLSIAEIQPPAIPIRVSARHPRQSSSLSEERSEA